MSPSPPLRKSGKDAPFEAGLLTHGRNADLLSAPSHPLRQWLFVADFVAVYSCEGSGGFAPLFPLTSGASWLSKTEMPKHSALLQSSPPKQSQVQQVVQFTKRELTKWVEAVNSQKNTNALDLLCRRSRASQSLLFAGPGNCCFIETERSHYADFSTRRHSPFPGA